MTSKPKRKYIRLSPAAWAEIRALWQTGEQSKILSQRAAVDDRRIFGEPSNQIKAADAAPGTAFEPGREIKQ